MFKKIFSTVLCVCIFASCLFLSSCGCSRQNKMVVNKETLQNTIKEKLSETKDSKEKNADEENFISEPSLFKGDKLSETILNITRVKVVDFDKSSVTVSVKAPDMMKIFEKVTDEIDVNAETSSDEQTLSSAIDGFYSRVIELIQNEEYDTMKKEVTLQYTADGEKINIEYNGEYLNAIYGGLIDYVNKNENIE